uniref:Uncharacterized protein n=1 Tax=Rhizophora mucronata TaxID=61149 RepID=A0A2P2PHG0_RHIMU
MLAENSLKTLYFCSKYSTFKACLTISNYICFWI